MKYSYFIACQHPIPKTAGNDHNCHFCQIQLYIHYIIVTQIHTYLVVQARSNKTNSAPKTSNGIGSQLYSGYVIELCIWFHECPYGRLKKECSIDEAHVTENNMSIALWANAVCCFNPTINEQYLNMHMWVFQAISDPFSILYLTLWCFARWLKCSTELVAEQFM